MTRSTASPRALRALLPDRRGAIGLAGGLMTVALVAAASTPVIQLTLDSDSDRMSRAAGAAGVAATQRLRSLPESESNTDQALREEAQRYAHLNLMDLSPADREKALRELQIALSKNAARKTVTVDLSTKLPGSRAAQAMLALAPTGGTGSGAVIPTKTTGKAAVECSTSGLDLVFALDLSGSMLGTVPVPGVPRADWPERRAFALDRIQELADNIRRACSEVDLRIGLVPWETSVRLPTDVAQRWLASGWVDPALFTLTGAQSSEWDGCLESRTMPGPNDQPADFPGLSAALPSSVGFPPYVYPDTSRHTERADWQARISAFLTQQEARGRTNLPHVQTAMASIEGDNDWSADGHGPNFGCHANPIVPLRTYGSGDTWLKTALDAIRAIPVADFHQSGTFAHLGITWATRLLDPDWAGVWDPDAEPSSGRHGAILLLTDGFNSLNDRDGYETVPGRAQLNLTTNVSATTGPWSLAPPLRGLTVQVANVSLAGTRVQSIYTSLGRTGAGARFDGHRPDAFHSIQPRSVHPSVRALESEARTALDRWQKGSCDFARSDGNILMAIGISPPDRYFVERFTAVLDPCAGPSADEPDEDGQYAFVATQTVELAEAFDSVANTLARFRRLY